MSARIGARLGRMLNLNAGATEDEFLHLADGDISPAGAFDLGAGQNATFGGMFQMGYGNVGRRQVLMSKHDDGDDAAGTAGWWVERTASPDNAIRVFLDDGAGNTLDVQTSGELVDDGFAHIIVITIDRDNDLLDLWWSPSTDSRDMVHAIQAQDISSLGSLENTAAFAIGAVFDGTPSNEDLLFRGGVGSAWWADEVFPDSVLKVFGRFQYYNPNDRRWVSFWTFAERNADDWNRTNANDLVENNIVTANYGPGPDRCVELASITTTPSTAKSAGTASMFFPRFRPAILQEGYFWQAGAQGAPPLRLRRTTKGASDAPNFAISTSIHTTNYGRYSSFASRDLIGTTVSDAWRLYDNKVRDEGDGKSLDGVEAWEPVGKIVGDADFRNTSWEWASDVPGGGEPSYVIGYSSGPGGGPAPKVICVDITDPSSPSKADTLDLAGSGGVRRTLVDINDPDTVYVVDTTLGNLYSIDWTTKTALALNATVSDAALAGAGANGWFVQIGTRLYGCSSNGVWVIDASTPTAPSFVVEAQTDPVGGNDDDVRAIVVLPDGSLMTAGTDGNGSGNGVIHVWSLADPDEPELVYREVGTASLSYSGIQRFDRRGTVVFGLKDPGANTRLIAWGVAHPKSPAVLATYDLVNYDTDLSGVTSTMSLDRDTFIVNKDSAFWGFFKVDGGVGQTALEAEFEPGGAVIADPQAPWEIEHLFADLGDLDFETDAPATTPPTGWTKRLGANSDPTVVDTFGLTGQPPGSATLPQSCRLRITAPDTDTGIRLTVTPAAADLEAGRAYPVSFWYYVDGAGTFDEADLELEVTETGGASGSESRTVTGTYPDKNRWHRVEMFYVLQRSDRTGFTVDISLLNSATHDVYIDTVRFGPGILAPLFSGRILRIESGEGEADGASLGYSAELIDKRFDLDRLYVDEKARDAATVEASLDALVTAYARSQDEFDTDNVYELGSHDRIVWGDDKAKLSEAIARLVTQGGGTWWLRDTSVFAMPPGFDPAPVALNDVAFGWFDLSDSEDGAELVTTGTARGDKSRLERHESSWDDDALKSRYGEIQYELEPNADVQSSTQTGNVRDYFRGLLGHTQPEGAFAVYDEPRLRPGQVIPVQIDVRGLDLIGVTTDVSYAVGNGGRLVVVVAYALIVRDLLELVLPQHLNQSNQRGEKRAVDDAPDLGALTF